MITTKYITLDFTKRYTEPINLVQYEVDARDFIITCTAGSLPINVTSASVVFYAKKPDGNILFNACEIIDAAAGKARYTPTGQTCAAAGDLRCWILITKDDAALRSMEFTVTVNPSEDDTAAIESASEFTALETALSTAANMVTKAASSGDGNIAIFDGINGDSLADSGINVDNIWTANNGDVIIETGSNSNGSYIKFSNGTMICIYDNVVTDQAVTSAYGPLYIGTRQWTFPAEFISTTGLIAVPASCRIASNATWGALQSVNITSATFYLFDIASRASGQNCALRLFAIGKWK